MFRSSLKYVYVFYKTNDVQWISKPIDLNWYCIDVGSLYTYYGFNRCIYEYIFIVDIFDGYFSIVIFFINIYINKYIYLIIIIATAIIIIFIHFLKPWLVNMIGKKVYNMYACNHNPMLV